MSVCSTRSLACAALGAALTLAAGCTRKPPCVKLSAAICDGAKQSVCEAFVDGEMAADGSPLVGDQKQSACQLVLDDPQTVKAMRQAFQTRASR